MGAKASKKGGGGGGGGGGITLDLEAVERHLDGAGKRLPYSRARELAGQSHFTTVEVQRMFRLYRRHADREGIRGELCSPVVLREALAEAGLDERRLRSQAYVDSLFAAFDKRVGDRNGRVDFTEFVLGVSTASRGSLREKLRLSFDLYDADGTGKVSPDELRDMLLRLHRHARGLEHGAGDREEDDEGDDARAVASFVDRVFAAHDTDRSGALSFEQYCSAVSEHPALAALEPPAALAGDAARLAWEREGLERGWLARAEDGALRLV